MRETVLCIAVLISDVIMGIAYYKLAGASKEFHDQEDNYGSQ